MCGSVTLQVGIEGTGVWSAAPAVALIEDHEAVGVGIKKPAVPGDTSRPRAAMQDDGWLATWISAGLPINGIAVTHFQEAQLIGLDLRIQISHILPASHSSLCGTLCRCDSHCCPY